MTTDMMQHAMQAVRELTGVPAKMIKGREVRTAITATVLAEMAWRRYRDVLERTNEELRRFVDANLPRAIRHHYLLARQQKLQRAQAQRRRRRKAR